MNKLVSANQESKLIFKKIKALFEKLPAEDQKTLRTAKKKFGPRGFREACKKFKPINDELAKLHGIHLASIAPPKKQKVKAKAKKPVVIPKKATDGYKIATKAEKVEK